MKKQLKLGAILALGIVAAACSKIAEDTVGVNVNPQDSTAAGVRKPGSTVAALYSIRIKPYAVNEFWVDPNNPRSGRHVVLFFRFNTNACRYPVARLWKNYERDWLNRWQIWVRYPAPNTEELMLFADGSFWWSHRLFNSAWGLAQQFDLCF